MDKMTHAEQIKALSKISKAIASEHYLEDILKLIVAVTAQVMGSNICSLMLIDEKKHELLIRATQSMSEDYNKKPPLKIGEGIAGMLAQAYGSQTIPFKFTQQSKSQLGWDLIALIETGRFKDYACTTPKFSVVSNAVVPNAIIGRGQVSIDDRQPPDAARLQAIFLQQAKFCQMEILPGPGKILRWSVPEGGRDPATGELVHDDLLLSAALCCVIDSEAFGSAESTVIKPSDPITQALAEKIF